MPTAAEVAARHCSPRALSMRRFRSYVEGTQYDGRWPFLQEADDAPPLLERAPCIVYPVADNAIRSHRDFVLGEGRWPAVRPKAGRLSEDVEANLCDLLRDIEERAKVPAVSREAFEESLSVGTTVVVIGVQDGCLELETVEAEWCTAKFDPAKRWRVLELEIAYPYAESFFDETDGKWKERCMLYRRVVDAQRDVTFEPIVADEEGRKPKPGQWVEQTVIEHKLGRCPVIWYASLSRSSKRGTVDGRPVHKGSLDEIDALNFSLSQRHRAALFAGDPMRWESGVDSSNPPGVAGRDAHVSVEVSQDGRGPHPKGTFRFSGKASRPRRVGAGAIWSSESPDYKVGMLTLPGDALKVIDDHARDLKAKLEQSLGVVDLDIENAKLASDMSGKAQTIARQRQVDADNQYRQDFGDRFLVPLLCMLLFVAKAVAGRNEGVALDNPGALANVNVDELQLDLAWGPYFPNTPADQKSIVDLCSAALKDKLITRRIAIEKLRSEGVFAIDSADAVASEPTLDDALMLQGLAIQSPTFKRIYESRLLASLLGSLEDADAKAILSEVEESAAHDVEPVETPSDASVDAEDVEVAKQVKIDITPTDRAVFVRVNEARANDGLGPIPDGDLTIAAYKAKHAPAIAAGVAAAAGEKVSSVTSNVGSSEVGETGPV